MLFLPPPADYRRRCSYPRVIDYAAFAEIAREVGAEFMVDMAQVAGLVAAGCIPIPLTLPVVTRLPIKRHAVPAAV